MASFGDFIKQERENHSWTQTDFGAKIGINSSAISRIEHGTKQLSANKLPRIAELFGLDISKVKELYYSDKFAREVYKNDCPETVFSVAEETVKYLKTKRSSTKQVAVV
ncbi:helix-turn-helix domain-containing protein [Mucilaginibacter gossypiicola]|nr:helix-turn-helix transcriptional regulator [Mucilaginibacter gossypiicola]